MPDQPYQAIRVQEADAINLVLHLGRVHGRRTVTELVRVRRYVEQLVGYRADDAARKIGGLILEVKGDFCRHVRDLLARHGRAEDYVEVSLASRGARPQP
jgi:hypothetical protein